MRYAFMCPGSENYNRNRKCRKCLHNLSHGCRCTSWLTFWRLYYFTTFYFLSYWLFAMAVLRAIARLYRAGEQKPIERYKTRVKVAEDSKLFILSSFLDSTSKLGVVWLEILPPNENQWQSHCGEYRLIKTAPTGAGIALLAWLRWGKQAKRSCNTICHSIGEESCRDG